MLGLPSGVGVGGAAASGASGRKAGGLPCDMLEKLLPRQQSNSGLQRALRACCVGAHATLARVGAPASA
eukprot:350593-Chlamydomonas_euryale.AAC.9